MFADPRGHWLVPGKDLECLLAVSPGVLRDGSHIPVAIRSFKIGFQLQHVAYGPTQAFLDAEADGLLDDGQGPAFLHSGLGHCDLFSLEPTKTTGVATSTIYLRSCFFFESTVSRCFGGVALNPRIVRTSTCSAPSIWLGLPRR